MAGRRGSENARRRSVTTRVSYEEFGLIREYAEGCGRDVSALTRDMWLERIGASSGGESRPVLRRNSGDKLLELFVKTMERSLEHGEAFTVQEFRQICSEIVGGK